LCLYLIKTQHRHGAQSQFKTKKVENACLGMADQRNSLFTTESNQGQPGVRSNRKPVHYLSDSGDAEWALIAPLIPPAKRGGRGREADLRKVMNGVLYVLETGCQWCA